MESFPGCPLPPLEDTRYHFQEIRDRGQPNMNACLTLPRLHTGQRKIEPHISLSIAYIACPLFYWAELGNKLVMPASLFLAIFVREPIHGIAK